MTSSREFDIDPEALYQSTADLLYRVALSQLQNREDAQDAVQEAFLKYLRVRPSLQSAEHARAWMIRVTVNQCRDLLRRKKVRAYLPLDEIAELIADEVPSPRETAGHVRELLQHLEALPPKNRIVLTLHSLEGLSVEEIAASLRLSRSAVKMRLSRGREQFRKLLEKEGSL